MVHIVLSKCKFTQSKNINFKPDTIEISWLEPEKWSCSNSFSWGSMLNFGDLFKSQPLATRKNLTLDGNSCWVSQHRISYQFRSQSITSNIFTFTSLRDAIHLPVTRQKGKLGYLDSEQFWCLSLVISVDAAWNPVEVTPWKLLIWNSKKCWFQGVPILAQNCWTLKKHQKNGKSPGDPGASAHNGNSLHRALEASPLRWFHGSTENWLKLNSTYIPSWGPFPADLAKLEKFTNLDFRRNKRISVPKRYILGEIGRVRSRWNLTRADGLTEKISVPHPGPEVVASSARPILCHIPDHVFPRPRPNKSSNKKKYVGTVHISMIYCSCFIMSKNTIQKMGDLRSIVETHCRWDSIAKQLMQLHYNIMQSCTISSHTKLIDKFAPHQNVTNKSTENFGTIILASKGRIQVIGGQWCWTFTKTRILLRLFPTETNTEEIQFLSRNGTLVWTRNTAEKPQPIQWRTRTLESLFRTAFACQTHLDPKCSSQVSA